MEGILLKQLPLGEVVIVSFISLLIVFYIINKYLQLKNGKNQISKQTLECKEQHKELSEKIEDLEYHLNELKELLIIHNNSFEQQITLIEKMLNTQFKSMMYQIEEKILNYLCKNRNKDFKQE